jgi:peroxiredoxin Q/BCP
MKSLLIVILLGLGVAGAALGAGGDESKGLAVGDPAPGFTLPGSDGKQHSLKDHLGTRAVVIAWFPKAFTGG